MRSEQWIGLFAFIGSFIAYLSLEQRAINESKKDDNNDN